MKLVWIMWRTWANKGDLVYSRNSVLSCKWLSWWTIWIFHAPVGVTWVFKKAPIPQLPEVELEVERSSQRSSLSWMSVPSRPRGIYHCSCWLSVRPLHFGKMHDYCRGQASFTPWEGMLFNCENISSSVVWYKSVLIMTRFVSYGFFLNTSGI